MGSMDPLHFRVIEDEQIVPTVVRYLLTTVCHRAGRGMVGYDLAGVHRFRRSPIIPHEYRGAQIHGRVVEVGKRRAPSALEIVLGDSNLDAVRLVSELQHREHNTDPAVQGDPESRGRRTRRMVVVLVVVVSEVFQEVHDGFQVLARLWGLI